MGNTSQHKSQIHGIPPRAVKISVCIPTYNHAHFLVDAVESVRAQTVKEFELVIVDNCSTDNTKEVVEKMMAGDNRITYVCNETNVGPVGNLNRCILHAQGEYLTILCADDVLAPTFLEKMSAALDDDPVVKLVACARIVVNENLKPKFRSGFSARKKHVSGHEAINKCLFNGNLIGEPSAVMFRRNAARRGFNMDFSQVVDLEMWFHILEQGDFVFLPEGLCLFRHYDTQGTKTNLKSFKFLADDERLFQSFITKPYIDATPFNIFNWKFRMAWNIWSHRRYIDDPAKVRDNISRFINRPLFYLLMLPAMGTKKIIKILDRMLAVLS